MASVVPPAGKPTMILASSRLPWALARPGRPNPARPAMPAICWTNARRLLMVSPSPSRSRGSAGRHAQRAVQADHLAIEVGVGDDVGGQLGELLRLAEPRRE